MSSSDESAKGTILGDRYRVEWVLGRGGMGTVYAVTDLGTQKPVALKMLASGVGESIRELFEREYRVLASLRHPCIVEPFEYGVSEHRAYYTMEILEGEDLSGCAPMPWRQLCRSLRDAASVLGVLHARRMAHRDLSPRNLWRTSEGRIKLLDFGAMVPFGVPVDVVGTPPLVPPEALAQEPLDARSDLYALGALGYWLLSSTYAYRARSLRRLPQAWEREPAVPSQLVRLIQNAEHDVPAELDELLLSMLALDRDQRPANTTEVIDRLNDIAGLDPERHDEVISGYLESKAFVGRRGACRILKRQRDLALKGEPKSTFVEGPEGIGRSRLLEEEALTSRVAGMIALKVGRSAGREPYAAAAALVAALLRALPMMAKTAAEPHVTQFSGMSDALRAQLGGVGNSAEAGGGSPSKDVAVERVEKQSALRAFVLSLSRQRALSILVDDANLLDEESQALFTTLALAERGHRLNLVISACSSASLDEQPNLRTLRRASQLVRLKPLSEKDTLELLRSTFDDVSYLQRLASRLHATAGGNPRDCLLIAEHLVRTDYIRYLEGAWILPAELPDSALPERRGAEGMLAALDGLSPEGLVLARCLSVPHHGDFAEPEAAAAAEMQPAKVEILLEELVGRRILQRSASGYSFVHDSLRHHLYAGLGEDARRRVHRALAEQITVREGDDPVLTLRAVVHWLRAGDVTRAEPALFEVGLTQSMGSTDELRRMASMFADVVQLLRSLGRDDHAVYLPMAALAYAGISVHPSYAEEFGQQAIETLSRGLRLPLAERLRPFMGSKLSLLSALGLAGITLRRTPYAPDIQRLSYCVVAGATAIAATSAVFFDSNAMRRATSVLFRLDALKRSGVVHMLAQVNEALSLEVEGRTTASQKLYRDIAARLEDPAYCPDLPSNVRSIYLAVAYCFDARNGALTLDESCFERADKAEEEGRVAFFIIAQNARAVYWANMGQTERAMVYRKEVELRAIQLGSAWQVEMWELPMRILFLDENAAAMKRAGVELERFGSSFPQFETFARWTRAAYLVLRGRHAQALELYRGDAEPDGVQNWAGARAWFARAFNGEGKHEQAHGLCSATLQRLDPEDREILFHALRLEVELAVAEVGMEQADAGHARLSSLFERFVPAKGPLVEGLLHCSRARMFFLQGDVDAVQRSLDEAEGVYGPLGMAHLLELVGAMRRAASSRTGDDDENEKLLTQGGQDSHVLTQVHLYLSSSEIENDTNPHQKALRLALELTHADRGFILETSGACFSHDGEAPASEVVRWAEGFLCEATTDGDTAAMDDRGNDSSSEADVFQVGGVVYRTLCMWKKNGDPFAAMVLGSTQSAPTELPGRVRMVFSNYLKAAGETARSA